MTCYTIQTDDGPIFICGDLGPHCECGGVNTVLCDFPVGHDKTCDRKLCERCAHLIGPDLHYCTAHQEEWRAFRESGGLVRELENVEPFKGRQQYIP